MPIYEFKCLQCDEYMEILVMGGQDDQKIMKCEKCGGESLERILSSTNFSVAGGGGRAADAPAIESRACSSGSCTTWNLPGHNR
ncbi:MAG: zinc ribbon domain-containing protein [Desulfatitalea sp.]|nr:zinc ribbon domain-containing protein [Desulfatitalea sp.]